MNTMMPRYGSDKTKWREIKNSIFRNSIIVITGITLTPILFILYQLVTKGIKQINFDFFYRVAPDTLEAMTASRNGEVIPGGIANGITGTFLIIVLAAVMAIPISILVGVFLYEYGSTKYASFVRSITDILQGVPSIVLGIISYVWIVKGVTKGFSALAGSIALAIMMLPLIIRSTEETMKTIPPTLKEAGAALGIPYYKIILKIMIPTGFSGLMTGILLAIARVLGETAPLMLTTLGNTSVNWDITKPTSAVPLQIWEFYNNPNMIDLVWSASLFLIGFVMILNLIAKKIAKRYSI